MQGDFSFKKLALYFGLSAVLLLGIFPLSTYPAHFSYSAAVVLLTLILWITGFVPPFMAGLIFFRIQYDFSFARSAAAFFWIRLNSSMADHLWFCDWQCDFRFRVEPTSRLVYSTGSDDQLPKINCGFSCQRGFAWARDAFIRGQSGDIGADWDGVSRSGRVGSRQ